MPTTPLSENPTINALLSTYQWGIQNGQSATITYSFPGIGSVFVANYGNEVTAGWSGLNAAQQDSFKAALGSWSELANLNFTQVADNAASSGQIRVTFSNLVKNQGFAGYAYYPTSTQSAKAGDVWLNPDYTDYSEDGPNFATMQHEIGHALGLKHPFATVAGNNAVLTGAEDSTQYTIMSYNSYEGAGQVYTSLGGGAFTYYTVQPSTPMLYDIAAIQFLYGANLSTRTGNDVYTFSNTQGEIKTIWDAGGTDTLDLSNQTLSQSINLNAGEFSSLGVAKTSFSGPLAPAVANIAIAYNVIIENARGGANDDTIVGNAINNDLMGGSGGDTIDGGAGNDRLFGNDGNDSLFGDLGSDRLDGGAGNDSLFGGLGSDSLDGGAGADYLEGGAGNDIYMVNTRLDAVIEPVNAGIDTVRSRVSWSLNDNVERLVLLGNNSTSASGNKLNNTLTGNNAANNISGGLGNDLLIGKGGSDNLTGGQGADTFVLDSWVGVDRITDFSVIFDIVRLENNIFSSLTDTGLLSEGEFVIGKAALDSNDYLFYDDLIGTLYYDADGNGTLSETPIATLGLGLALTQANFWVA